MSWIVDKDKLFEAIAVLDLVPSRSGIAASVFVRLDGNGSKLRMSLSSEVSGQVVVRGEGKWPVKKPFYLDRRLLFPFIYVAQSVSTKSGFEFQLEKKELLVRHGRRRARFSLVDSVMGFDKLKKKKASVRMHIDDRLRKLMLSARGCAVDDPSLPHLNCIYLKPGKKTTTTEVYTTNGAVGFHAVHKVKKSMKNPLPFPLYVAGLLKEEGVKRVLNQKNQVVLEFENGDIWQMVSAKAAKKFPVKTIIKMLAELRKTKSMFRMECRRLHNVVERLLLYLASVSRQDWVLWLKGSKGGKEILFEVTVPQGVFREKVPVHKALVSDVEIEWPLAAMIPVFQYLGDLKDKSLLDVRGGVGDTPYFLTTGELQVAVSSI